MACDIENSRNVPLFALLDDDELKVLAARVAAEIQGLARKLNLLIDKVDDLDDSVRGTNRLTRDRGVAVYTFATTPRPRVEANVHYNLR